MTIMTILVILEIIVKLTTHYLRFELLITKPSGLVMG